MERTCCGLTRYSPCSGVWERAFRPRSLSRAESRGCEGDKARHPECKPYQPLPKNVSAGSCYKSLHGLDLESSTCCKEVVWLSQYAFKPTPHQHQLSPSMARTPAKQDPELCPSSSNLDRPLLDTWAIPTEPLQTIPGRNVQSFLDHIWLRVSHTLEFCFRTT